MVAIRGETRGWRERWVRALAQFRQEPGTESLRRFEPLVKAACDRRGDLQDTPTFGLLDDIDALRTADWQADSTLIAFCAAISELLRRLTSIEPHPVQLLGAMSMLRGIAIDMATGEGKTLVGSMVAAAFALQDRCVHVLSANEYLAVRDARSGAVLFDALGVTSAVVTAPMTGDERRVAYRADVVFSTIQQLGFDQLRDRQVTRHDERRLRELDVAIVDELDAVLIDEALVPLVLAGDAEDDVVVPGLAKLVASLRATVDFTVDEERRNVILSDSGIAKLERFFHVENLFAHTDLLGAAHLALHAEVLLERDVHYLVSERGISLVNETRGRIAHLQRWPDGLHAAVEMKEGLAPSSQSRILDQTLVQTVAHTYRTLVGMSGTAVEGAERLAEDHGLRIAAVSTNVPCARIDEADRLFATASARDRSVVERITEAHAVGQPVLVGTSSVADSERFATLLEHAGVTCEVLNAKHDADEAAIIARAGMSGAVTISTQMAGRGVDIRLDDAARERGGLLVIGLGRHESVRLDHQLRGRSGRQGDPGTSTFFTSLEDDVVVHHIDPVEIAEVVALEAVPSPRALRLYRRAQRVAEGKVLQAHRKTSAYNQVLEHQRAATLAVRDGYLADDGRIVELLTELQRAGLERDRARRLRHPEWIEFVRQIVLYRIDEGWADHLAHMSDVKEGIHLRALANAVPLVEFTVEARTAFAGFTDHAAEAVLSTLLDLDLDRRPGTIAELGMRRPTSTWTYMIEDNPFGTAADRVIRSLAKLIRPR
ncbi:accessory Sec system translocase SecA2 [Agromyces silvae]|uniref:accessory Sec system translocase SecA2 n=1 Tax=Agromyces silvae TaxID=3388266 RepID=UPI00280B9564|nr:accessory Sec system translocase SecA2 [Agromyces protaetiae]